MEQDETRYIKGFNSGYLLAQYDPELLTMMLQHVTPSGGYIEGLFQGQGEYLIELDTKKELDELNQLRNKSNDRDLERE